MITTSTPGAPRNTLPDTASEGTDAGRVLAGLATGIVLQIGAACTAAFALFIVVAAAFANYGNYGEDQESTWWMVFSVPLAVFAVALYIVSGFAASRVMRSNLGWLTLLTVPGLVLMRFAVIAIG